MIRRPGFVKENIWILYRGFPQTASSGGGVVSTILGWNSVPATRVATAISFLWPANTGSGCRSIGLLGVGHGTGGVPQEANIPVGIVAVKARLPRAPLMS
jgi:hypothetical protein